MILTRNATIIDIHDGMTNEFSMEVFVLGDTAIIYSLNGGGGFIKNPRTKQIFAELAEKFEVDRIMFDMEPKVLAAFTRYGFKFKSERTFKKNGVTFCRVEFIIKR